MIGHTEQHETQRTGRSDPEEQSSALKIERHRF